MKYFIFALFFPMILLARQPARIGSKIFTEGYILSEVLAQKLETKGFPVERLLGLGATGVTEAAMKNKKIDLIVDYTGSIIQDQFGKYEPLTVNELRAKLEKTGFTISDPLGFNDTYALAVRPEWAKQNNIYKISDLRNLTSVTAAFTPEFTGRDVNWPGLKNVYHLTNFQINEMDHQLAYEAIHNKKVDIIEAYSTDAKLKEYQLETLVDDLNYFPSYQAVIMTHLDWIHNNPDEWQLLQDLVGTISDNQMIELNSQVDVDKKSFSEVARNFLKLKQTSEIDSVIREQIELAKQHLFLVLIPVLFAIIFGVPFGYLAFRVPWMHTPVASVTTIFQTIPSLAFLTILIPFAGIGSTSAMIVLFVYALLPIFINSYEGFVSIPALTHLSCDTLHLKGWFKLKQIEFPIALPQIFAGIQLALITTVATATLAALIGAGGYGRKIIAGLAINDLKIVLSGAIPCALMALIIQFVCHQIAKRFR
jgi:osmoprotectant transport system permease protein